MTLRRATARILVLLVFVLPLAACHVSGHLPPGQLKKGFVSPPSAFRAFLVLPSTDATILVAPIW